MKRILLATLLVVAFAFGSKAETIQVGDLCYNITGNNTVEVTSGSQYSGDITIPSSVTSGGKTYSVTSIGEEAFQNCSGLTSVTIPSSVTSIGNYAFAYCSGLTSVTIPSSVTSIGSDAFYGCSGLTSVTIPNSVTSIGSYAFYGCSGLTSIDIPNSVTSIGYQTFYNCSGLTSIDIPNSVTRIGDYAFMGCSGLTSIDIPNSVTRIGEAAFEGCNIETIFVPQSVTSIGWNAFNNVGNVIYNGKDMFSESNYAWGANNFIRMDDNFVYTDDGETIICYIGTKENDYITIPDNVKTIGNYAFSGCTNVSTVIIHDYVNIGNHAFEDCTGLIAVYIFDHVWCIGSYAFAGCDNVVIHCESESPYEWDYYWNPDKRPVIWNYKNMPKESIVMEKNIYAHHNVIVVENADTDIYVYDASGRLVARRNVERISTEEIVIQGNGIYVVKVGSETKRVYLGFRM